MSPSTFLPLGLGLGGPLLLSTLTAPAERVKLLLQTQDEIILNLREESLAAHHRHYRPNQSMSPRPPLKGDSTKGYDSTADKDSHATSNHSAGGEAEDGDEDEDEPRSIIVPYAQLPYVDTKDCFTRLVEKEGRRSLWRGYSLECARFALQAGIDAGLQRRQFGAWLDLRRWFVLSTETFGGTAAWILGASVQGTVVSTVALLVAYPLATLQTKMATDVVRRTRKVKQTVAAAESLVQSNEPAMKDMTEAPATHTSKVMEPPLSSSSTDTESVEWIEHMEDQGEGGDLQVATKEEAATTTVEATAVTATATLAQEYEYEYVLSYKHNDVRDALRITLESSEGVLGLYKGFSSVIISTFVSRVGSLALFRMISPILVRFGGGGSSRIGGAGVGAFLLIFGATSAINLLVYPLSTVCHCRMTAAPGRYSSSWDAGRQIVEKQGWRALYRGYEVTMLRSAAMAILSRIFC
ncbi:hypothetical protein BGZ54_007109 [Gamsiella multidivaricata]|nr:hypothetical protein BGZ54_007109 [Gamsiella multidivaricata]